ncbi:hypothetical protein Tco_0750367 [Tanacetum coccineum]|uniref:Uncharacterized protein n=1 Tax=Tanacetum coccineum TaxID=301880 RepID=A0ABQ4Z253_9ASTR
MQVNVQFFFNNFNQIAVSNEVNEYRSERLARSANPLALLGCMLTYSDNYYLGNQNLKIRDAPSYKANLSFHTSHCNYQTKRQRDRQNQLLLKLRSVLWKTKLTTHNNQTFELLHTPGTRPEIQTTTKGNIGKSVVQQMGYRALTARDLDTMPRNWKHNYTATWQKVRGRSHLKNSRFYMSAIGTGKQNDVKALKESKRIIDWKNEGVQKTNLDESSRAPGEATSSWIVI